MKILVVDDEAISRMALMDVIQSAGNYRVQEASSGEEAWTQLNAALIPPMLVCCDIRMPVMSGIELLQRARANPAFKDLPFVLISMANDADTIKSAIQFGVSGYIVKPFTQGDARARLDKVLSQCHARMLEAPESTMARMKLMPDRYRAYLLSLQRQLELLVAEFANALNAEALKTARERMALLETGLAPLGLWRAAQLFKRCAEGEPTAADAAECLDEVRQHVHLQLCAI
ncbi:two-component system chemotaxis response regulator CheY [Inhella inkyongensis]|uniref:Two-component system chemotaxis response regulator CheY n=1 Tax=Inhella inkyongensis TaxID=392593 RepID=A0A840RZ84_9BURK|nr:response regulator [Inhella inkyongensis]MBB5204087.1 two-component system chemotaxis response regulator CheY [Inhella inkyongensis]